MSSSSDASSTRESVITIVQNPAIVTAIERFNVPSEQQANAVAKATDHITQQWKTDPEFIGALLLRGRTRGGVTCYAQWKRPADGSVPTAPAGSQSLAAALPAFELLDSRTYTVEFTDQAASVTPPAPISVRQTPYAHFGIFRVTREHQDQLLDRARANAPKSLTTEGLLAINFHRSIDGLQVINLGMWTTFDHMNSLLQRPGFRDDAPYWAGIADFQPDFFDVVAVEAGQ